jgi:hypothetical protein
MAKPNCKYVRWDQTDEAFLLATHRQKGWTLAKIATALERTEDGVRSKASSMGLSSEGRITKDTRAKADAKVAQCVAADMSLRETAGALSHEMGFKVSPSWCGRSIERQGLRDQWAQGGKRRQKRAQHKGSGNE